MYRKVTLLTLNECSRYRFIFRKNLFPSIEQRYEILDILRVILEILKFMNTTIL